MLDLSSILRSAHSQDGLCVYTTDESWLQGRSLFGGLQAAIAVDAMQRLSADMPPLRTLQATLCAPISGPQVRVHARLLRAGGEGFDQYFAAPGISFCISASFRRRLSRSMRLTIPM